MSGRDEPDKCTGHPPSNSQCQPSSSHSNCSSSNHGEPSSNSQSHQFVCSNCKQLTLPRDSGIEIHASSYEQKKCSAHPDNILEFFCSTCNKSACELCQLVLRCGNSHAVIPMHEAVELFNQNTNEVLRIAKDSKNRMEKRFDDLFTDKANFEYKLKLCKTAIQIQKTTLIDMIKEKSSKFLSDLENLHRQNEDTMKNKVADLESKQNEVSNLEASTKAMLDQPELSESLESHKKSLSDIRDQLIAAENDQSPHRRNIVPNFIPSHNLVEKINTQSIGEITMVNDLFKVAASDEKITVPKGKPFVVTLSSQQSGLEEIKATLRNTSAGTADVEYKGSGEYNVTGRCSVNGDFIMELTAGGVPIKGSPVYVKVEEETSKVHTIDNISYFKDYKDGKVNDVMIDKDSYILVSSYSNCIIKFNRAGTFIGKELVPRHMQVIRMFRVGYDQMVYSEFTRRCVIKCDSKLHKICSYGKGILKYPMGLTVDNFTKVMYVTDRESHCVFKFNIDDCKQLGKIGSEGNLNSQMNSPHDVILTKTGNLIVADFGNNRLQMFDPNGKFIRIFVGEGKEDGMVYAPCGLAIDFDGNIIVSSNHKVQLFDRNGVFIKRLDHKDDELDIPSGVTVISNSPKRVAVANYGQNNVKIFNY